MLYYVYIIAIVDGMYVRNVVNILYLDVAMIIMR